MYRRIAVAGALLLAIVACASPAAGTTITFQQGVSPDGSYAGCEDNWIYSYYPTTNYGTNTWGNGIGFYSGGTKRSLIRFDVSAVPSGASVTSARLRLLMNTIGANRTLEAYEALQSWTQLGSTWQVYDTGSSWNTAGCGGSGTDYAATTAGSTSVTTSQAGTWVEIDLDTSLVEGWVSGTITNNGLLLKVTDESSGEMRYRAENYSTASERPQLVVEYTTDTTAPAAVTDLAAGSATTSSLTLTWTAPGDDGSTGTAASYDIRYSTSTIDDSNWASATQVTGEPTPSIAGTGESMVVSGLSQTTTYYFAIKTSDEVPNVSALSNVASGTTASPGTTLYIDLQDPSATTASGYSAVTYSNRWDNSTQADLGGGIEAGWLDWFQGGSFNRTGYTDLFLRDALYWSSSAPAETLKITGIVPGNYDLTLYGVDLQYNDKRTGYDIDQDNDGVTDVSTTIRNNLSEQDKTVAVTISSAGILQITVDSVDGMGGAFNGLELVPTGGGGDTTPPAAVTDLATSNPGASSITLTWTAPGDDGNTGTADSYDVRYSTSTIDEGNWGSATQATGEPTPSIAGSGETMTVNGLDSGTTYYFAIKASDEASNVAGLSNVASGTTTSVDTTPPAAVTDLATSNPTAGSLTLTWTAPGDDGNTGTASSYDVRYSTSTIDDTSWASATQVTGEPTPSAAGTGESMVVSGLSQSTTYYFAVKTSDEVPNVSALSNVASGTTASPGTELHIDLQDPSGTTAANYQAVTYSHRWDNSSQADLGGGIEAGWLDYFNGGSLNRTGYTDLLLRDALSWTSGTPAETLKITGLAPGGYSLKIYGKDLQYNDKRTNFDIDADNDGITDANVTIRNNLGEQDKTVNINVSAAGILKITVVSLDGMGGAFNGLDLIPDVSGDTTPPAAVTNLAAGSPSGNSLTLTWTAPGDDGNTGTANSYDIRYSTSTINDSNWLSATQVIGEPTPAAAGTPQSLVVSGLSAETTYYFAMKTSDEVPNTSALSNVASGTTTSSGSSSDIAMIVEEHFGVPRDDEVVSGGVPFAVGDLSSYSGLRVEDGGGNPVPAQFSVLNRWWSPNYDNSIKWLEVVFPADVSASGSNTYYLRPGTNPAPADPASVTVNGNVYTVTTGKIKAVINGSSFKLFDEVYFDADDDGVYDGSEKIIQAAADDGLVITSGAWSTLGIAAGDEFRSSVATPTVTVEEDGPVRVVLCIMGRFQRSGQTALDPYYEYTVRMYFTAGSSKVRCHVTLKNNAIVDYTVYTWPIEDFSLRSTLALSGTKSYAMLGQGSPVRGTVGTNVVKVYQDSNGTDEWQTTGGETIRGVTFRGYRIYDGTTQLETNNQARGWIDVNNGTLGVAAGVREFWQQYPKALRIDGDQLQVALLPSEWSELFSVFEGSRKRHEVVYDFHAGSLSDPQVVDEHKLAERPLHMRCSPSTYVDSKAWDLGLGTATGPAACSYNKYATTGTGIGEDLGWDWYGNYYAWNPGGMHPNQGSMFMPYVLWGDWRAFEQAENRFLWSDLAGAVCFDHYNQVTDWHYLTAYPGDGSTGITKMRYPGWYNRCTQTRPDRGHCGMLQNLEYYYLTGDRHALEAVEYYGQLAEYHLWPRIDRNPPWYSPYNGDVDDPDFQVSDRYWGWPLWNLVQAYEGTGDTDWLHLAEITVKGIRNTMRISPLKFTHEGISPVNDTGSSYWAYFTADQRDNGASQNYAIFQMSLTTKAVGLYYLATGDMDAFDIVRAHADFLSDYGCFRDASDNLLGWTYCWGDYWGFSTSTPSVHPDIVGALSLATLIGRDAQLQADCEDIWPLCTNKTDWIFLGYAMNAVENPDSDQTAPAAVSTLSASQGGTGQINLSWTAPGDDGSTGTAWRYQIKYSTAPIVESVTGWPDWTPPVPQTVNDWKTRTSALLATQRPFVSAINVLDLPAPASAGTQQSKTVSGLTSSTTYYFAIKTLDEAGNLSSISNVASAVAP